MKPGRIVLFVVLIAAIGLFFVFDLKQYLTLEFFEAQRDALIALQADHRWLFAIGFFLVYVLVTGTSLPGAALLTLIAGALFGLVEGVILVSFASTIGATMAFTIARFLFRDVVRQRFGQYLTAIDRGIEREGAFYLFALRLVPAVPFFVVNLAMSLTPISTWRFYWVSQLGMLFGTVVYVNAGAELGQIESVGDILSPALWLSFALLGIAPLLAKKILDFIKSRKILRNFKKPRRFDNNLVVIGAGSGGLVAALIAATVKAKVTLIERHRMGGDCLNTGCVPSKTLLRSARMLSYAARAKEFGFQRAEVSFEFQDVMARVRRVIKKIEPHDSVERYTEMGVHCIMGDAKITSPYCVQVNGEEITTRNIVIATGGTPFVPPIAGLEDVNYFTSDTIWDIDHIPNRLVVLGGGPIGSELTQAFCRFGSKVTLVEQAPHMLIREDADVSSLIENQFAAEGVNLLTQHRALRVDSNADEKILICEKDDGTEVHVPFDSILVAVGRKPNTQGLGLEDVGVVLGERGDVEVDEYLRTNVPTIYACGDAIGPYQFTHTASHEAWYASVNPLFGPFKRFKANYSVIPWTTFTDPEVGRVGLNEKEAEAQGIEVEVTRFDLEELDRALADEEGRGFVKVITPVGKDKILGVTVVGHHAGDLLAEFIAAMKWGKGLKSVMGNIHIYPTLAEANKFAASAWRKKHAPEKLLDFVAHFHHARRGFGAGSGLTETNTS
ncbi:MAG: SidA/IucD/PvdA family monooxygenase [Gammaproteobacteria bacterium]|nr:SidA/IucD/PvdA family monooxygenase [Gammaproteobacteria bacterium]